MGSARQEMLEHLFDAAVRMQTPGERDAFLDESCGDPLLRATLESLLKAHDEAGTFLETPVVDVDATITTPARETPGTRIGHYRILQLIGEGGFGSVYMAEQDEPVRRKVALKIIKLGMDTRQVIARFEAERQALALMDHPNIAKVLDAGSTEGGRPYFVMELVRGIRITEYCDQNRLPIRERLSLFQDVCLAIQHAHQKGIIHRDVKPNNVLVTLHEDHPVPKVIDFGIAKATSQRLTEKTLYTEFRQFIGTPEYMSPDQAEVGGLDIDTRTDIYSLGVLLYELLTGTTPFDRQALRSAGYDEIKRIIREVEPPRPSARVHALRAQDSDVARLRQTEPALLERQLRGDLDWIVMKALEKDRTRRYQTATELAADLQRHLQHQPVLAGPPGAAYKLRKFIRRNRAAVIVAGVVSGALLLGATLATVGFIQATAAGGALKQERDIAEQARADERDQRRLAERHAAAAQQERARAQAALAREAEQRRLAELHAVTAQAEAAKLAAVNDFVRDILSSVDPRRALGREVTVREILDAAVPRIEGGSLSSAPAVEAAVRTTIGKTYEALGQYDAAEAQLRAAEALCTRTLGGEHPDTLRTLSVLAGLLESRCEYYESETLARRTAALQRHVLGPEHPDTLATQSILGVACWRQGKLDEAERIHRETLAVQRRVLGEEHPDTLASLVNLGTVFQSQGRYTEAEATLRQALEVERRVLGDEHPGTLTATNSLALVLERQGKYAEAEGLYRHAWELDRRVYGAEHPLTRIPFDNLLRVLFTLGKVGDATDLVSERLDRLRDAAGQPGAPPTVLNRCAEQLLTCEPEELRDVPAALDLARRAVELDGGRNPQLLATLALALHMSGEIDQAVEIQRQAVARARADNLGSSAELEASLIDFLMEKGDMLSAGRLSMQRLVGRLTASTIAGTLPGGSLALDSQSLMDQGEWTQAEVLARECLAVRQTSLTADHWLIWDASSLLGATLAGQGRFSEAETILLAAHAHLAEDTSAPPDYRRRAVQRIIRLYETWDRPDQAAAWRRVAEDDSPATTADQPDQRI